MFAAVVFDSGAEGIELPLALFHEVADAMKFVEDKVLDPDDPVDYKWSSWSSDPDRTDSRDFWTKKNKNEILYSWGRVYPIEVGKEIRISEFA